MARHMAKQRTLNIVYTGGVAGELEPCGCSPKTDFGGVARRAQVTLLNIVKRFLLIFLLMPGIFSIRIPSGEAQGRGNVESLQHYEI